MSNNRKILSLLDSSKRVLVIGDIILEKYVHGTYNRTSPENSMPVFRIEKEEYRLAGTGNIIRNLLLMNLAVDVVSVIGNNDKIVLDLLKDMKLDMYGITRSQNYCVKTITRYFCNKRLCFQTDNEENGEIPEEMKDTLLQITHILNSTKIYNCIVIASCGHKLVSTTIGQYIIQEANLRGIPTIVDTNIKSDDHIFYGATFLKLNHEEANGICLTENEDLSIKCKNVCEQFKAQVSMIMMLEKGLAFYKHNDVPPFQVIPMLDDVKMTDNCGAGDAALTAFVFGIIHQWTITESCQFANSCTADVLERFGTASVSMINVISQKVLTTQKEVKNLKWLIPEDATVVLTTGCFDIIHVGHVDSLRQAKDMGDILIVALNSDVSVKSYKGDTRPIIPIEQRCRMLQDTKHVDFIVIFDESVPRWIVDILDPDIFAKGDEYNEERIRKDFPSLRKICNTHDAPEVRELCTTYIINKIKKI